MRSKTAAALVILSAGLLGLITFRRIGAGAEISRKSVARSADSSDATLYYALSYKQTAASIRAHPEQYNIFTATREQKMIMVRGNSKTEIYAVNLREGTRRAVFSDEGPIFEITPVGGEQALVFSHGRAFARGVEREWRTGRTPGIYSKPPGIYELLLDGSNTWRRIVELPEKDQTGKLFVATSGTKLGYMTNEYGKETVSIFKLPSRSQLHAWNAREWSHRHCPDVNFGHVGWLSDDKSLFLVLQSADMEDDSTDSPCNQTYFVTEDGTELDRMPSRLIHKEGGASAWTRTYFIGEAQDGSDLYVQYVLPHGPNSKSRKSRASIVAARPGGTAEQVQLQTHPFANRFWLSPSGRYVAFLEGRLKDSYQSEMHAWVKDLKTGREIDVVGIPPLKYGSPDPQVTLTVLGVAGGEE